MRTQNKIESIIINVPTSVRCYGPSNFFSFLFFCQIFPTGLFIDLLKVSSCHKLKFGRLNYIDATPCNCQRDEQYSSWHVSLTLRNMSYNQPSWNRVQSDSEVYVSKVVILLQGKCHFVPRPFIKNVLWMEDV